MLRSVCFLLLLLFSLSSSHDGKQLVLAEDELQDGSSLDCGGEPSCYRKGDPYNSNGSTIGSEIQTSRLLLMADLNGAASRGVLFPSISYSQSRTLPSTIILSPAQNMLKNSKLASSANRSASVVESPSVFSGNLQNKGSNWPLSWTINTPQFCSLSPPSLAVQPSVHPPTHKHFFSKLVLDHMSHLGTPKYCVPPVFLQGINSRSLIRRAHVHNVPPFRSSHQEANHNGAPYFLISPSSLTTGKMKPIEAAFSAYDSVRSGASLPLTHYRQSQESLHFGKYTRSVLPSYPLPVFAPSLVPMHYGQPQDPPSQRVQAPENQPSVRLLPPSNGWPLKALPPIASDGEPARGPFLNENQPPKALPPTLASLGLPTVTSPHLLSPDAEQYQMHPSAFHPVMPNPSNHTKWLSPRVLGTPSQLQPPVEHTRTSVSPSGPVASPPRILPNETSRKESSMPIRALPRTRSRRQAPIAAPYNNQEPFSSPPASIPSQPLPKNPRTAELAPSIKFVSPPYQQGLRGSVSSPHASPPFESPSGNAGTPAFTPPFKGTISSPTSLPSEPPEAAPSIIFPSHEHHHNMRAWPKNISKGQAPVALAPKIQGHVIPPVRQPSRSPMEYPGRPESAPSIAFNSPQYSRDENVQGPVASSPSIFPSAPRQKKPSIPVAAQPRNRNPVALAPKNQVPVTPISLPSKAPVEYPGTPEEAPLIRFHLPPRNRTMKGPASPPRLSPSISHRPRSIIPVANQPRKGSWRHSPAITAPIIQGSVSSPLITPPPEQPNYRTIIAPSIVFPSPSHYPRVKGHLTPPGNAPSEPPQKKLRTPVAPPPRIRSWSHAPAAIPPTSQGPSSPPHEHYRRYSGVPPFPPITFPSPPYHQRMEGPVSAPTSIASSKAPKKTPNVPLAAPPSKRSWSHAPSAIPPINQGPVASAPMMFPSVPAQQKPTVQVAAPPSKRSSEHAPVASPLMAEGPVYSPVNRPLPSPSGKLRPPAVSPSIRFHSPTYHRHVKGSSASSAPAPSKISPTPHHYWGMKGPVASTPRMVPSADSAPPQKKPSIPMAAPPGKSSSKHAPVSSPTMGEGPIYSPVNRPLLSPSGNLRPPAVSPSIGFHSPPHHRHVKGPSASSAPEPSRISPTPHHYWGTKGPVASTPKMIPCAPPQKKPSIPMAAPPSKSSSKHTPVASPTMGEGPVYSSVNHPLPSPSGNLRPPTISPSIGFRPPPHHRHVKGNLSPPAVSPSIMFPSSPNHQHVKGPSASPANIAPSESPHMTRRIPLAPPPLVFPPPPPSQDCSSIVCTQPLTSTPPGAPCGCVYPMQVELELGVALYAFFPLVSELAAEIAAGTFLKQSQVRIMGANADTQDQEKTIVILDLVPLGEKFDNTTAFLIFERFWQKKVIINETLFSDYWVISVSYPGLPPPPPSAFSNATINGEPTNSSGPSKHEPLGVDINKRSKKMGAGIIAVVALSSAIGAVICVGAVLITLLKCKNRSRPVSVVVEPTLGSSAMKRSGGCGGSILSGSMESSTSLSFASSMAPYTGSAKTITIAELERATDRFSSQNILGEGGFGRVYRGVLEDGTKVAVKVLTRDDQQGGREFIAEVEMLSRLHHRNLVKLIGICTEEHNRSLVYELIPNGSVESHLHGLDKERAPLDWDARIKIALGAARGLAYLHEDSSPRVIHRDFKASNILLEDDFTPKVSDFGLAKSASEEVSGHISTRVMGTFGYVAPEYAMTGHLLVKSDVYSYGVVLLELLTGRKPVDMSQPPGQENLVTWARPLLTSKEGLEALVDPALGSNLPFDNIARVAAIASMCVQPEVSHRPFMGEVVQALKLVCNDSDTSNGGGSGHFSQGGESNAHYTEVKDGSSQQWPQSIQYVPDDSSFVTIDYDSGPLQTQGLETERPLSASALLSTSGSLTRQFSGSFRRHSSSGPLRTNKSKKSWYGIRGLAGGSISEHGVTRHEDVHELWP